MSPPQTQSIANFRSKLLILPLLSPCPSMSLHQESTSTSCPALLLQQIPFKPISSLLEQNFVREKKTKTKHFQHFIMPTGKTRHLKPSKQNVRDTKSNSTIYDAFLLPQPGETYLATCLELVGTGQAVKKNLSCFNKASKRSLLASLLCQGTVNLMHSGNLSRS